MVIGLIVGHSDFGQAVLHAAESIAGDIEHIEYVSNDGLSTDDLVEKLRAFCGKNSDDSVLVFVDVYGGSCWRAAKMARLPNSNIIAGLNLPMLLSFMQKRKSLSFDELVHVIENDGKRAIKSE